MSSRFNSLPLSFADGPTFSSELSRLTEGKSRSPSMKLQRKPKRRKPPPHPQQPLSILIPPKKSAIEARDSSNFLQMRRRVRDRCRNSKLNARGLVLQGRWIRRMTMMLVKDGHECLPNLVWRQMRLGNRWTGSESRIQPRQLERQRKSGSQIGEPRWKRNGVNYSVLKRTIAERSCNRNDG